MDNSQNKIGFFKRIKIAIFKLEEYGIFLGERVSKSIKYFLLLILLMTAAIVLAESYEYYDMLNKGVNYIKNEMPNFSYSDGTLNFENVIKAYDEQYDFKLYIDTSDNISDETIEEYKEDINTAQDGMILLKDKYIYVIEEQELEGSYSDLATTYDLSFSNKQELIEVINGFGITNVMLIYWGSTFIPLYLVNVITIFMDLLLIAIFGYIASRICGIKFKMSPMITLSIYSLTLSIVLSGIYNVVYILTGFEIKYFNIMYLLIAYVYIVAAILMIKYDYIKQNEELQKIIEVQKQVKKESDENLEDTEEKEKDTEDKKEKEEKQPVEVPKEEENKEPDGSEI